MGNNHEFYNKFNNVKDIAINIKLDKTCYFPEDFISGDIIITPQKSLLNQLMEKPELNIYVIQYQQYVANEIVEDEKDKTKTHLVNKKITLVKTALNFKDIINQNPSNESFSISFSIQIPKETYPSIFIDESTFSKHFFNVTIPQFNAQRSKILIIKNIFPNNKEGTLLRDTIHVDLNLNKSKVFVKKVH